MLERQNGDSGSNLWIVMLLSMIVIFGYPYFTKMISKPVPAENQTRAEEREAPSSPRDMPEETPQKFFEPPSPPETIQLENAIFEMEISTLGGSISSLTYKPTDRSSGLGTNFFSGEPSQPGIFSLTFSQEKERLDRQIFSRVASTPSEDAVMVYERPGDYRVVKKFSMDAGLPVIRLTLEIHNLSERERHFPAEIFYAFLTDQDDPLWQQHHEALVMTDKIQSANAGKLRKKTYSVRENASWAGMVKKYFALLVKPDWKIVGVESDLEDTVIGSTLKMEPVTLGPGASDQRRLYIYAGPQRYESLKELDMGFEDILSKGFFGTMKLWLLLTMKFFYRYTHNFGWAIVLLTLLIKGLFAPLTHLSYKSMKKMQAIQPKIKALQDRLKKEPEKLNKEMMALFKRNKVNPMAGCLPMLIQIPVFIAMFKILPEAIELRGAPFLFWITDLSAPDRFLTLPFVVPFLKWDALNLLPILMVFSQIWYQKLMPQTSTSPEQAKIMNLMPIFFGFICYNMSSGLVLYWIVQNLATIIQQAFINRVVVNLHHEDHDA